MSLIFDSEEEFCQKAINRRKIQEEERKKRFFNPNVRCLGIDMDGIEAQINEKKDKARKLQELEELYANQVKNMEKNLKGVEQICNSNRKLIQGELNQVNKFLQDNPQLRREYDLNRPDALYIDKPARIGDNDERCGISSIQKFVGEDLGEKERKLQQLKQRRVWIQQSLQKNNELKKQMEEAERQEVERISMMDKRLKEVHEIEKALRKERLMEMVHYNKTHIRKEEKCLDVDTTSLVVKNRETDGEKRRCMIPAMSDRKFDKPDRWRYKSDREKQDIQQEKVETFKERQQRRDLEKQINQEWDKALISMDLTVEQLELEKQNLLRERRQNFCRFNIEKSKEDVKRINHIEKVVYTNRPSEDYFSQFNTSSR